MTWLGFFRGLLRYSISMFPPSFIESWQFTQWITEHFEDHEYARIQLFLEENPDYGRVMPGCGGLRKLRIADPGRQQGKRGGARLIYLHVPAADRIYMVAGFGKNEKADLPPEGKKMLRDVARKLQAEALELAAAQGKRRRST